jgi:hypothetical protein
MGTSLYLGVAWATSSFLYFALEIRKLLTKKQGE